MLLTAFLFLSISASVFSDSTTNGEKYIFDFTGPDGVEEWQEQSDTVRSVGMSKAVLVMHQNTEYKRAVFFALLNPQTDGSGFAGVRDLRAYDDLTGYTKLQLRCRAQGQFNGFKVVLRHKGLNNDPNFTFEQLFEGPQNEFAVRDLPFSEFKAFFHGREVETNDTLDVSQITSIGIQMYGGVFLPVKQSGPATLEIDWIKAVN
ncbi:uncharacterized protein LOC125237960 [Leguminivora glycinivorella]|uniref:uncharacterized protein LOC125237960 n=1 Tax=Leguminivora glycinivorella TaxID=1035111 RepID=UPI00200FEEA5|nr:uncharacterized protein LOC125237960 [Leguminivora glycinivorella]